MFFYWLFVVGGMGLTLILNLIFSFQLSTLLEYFVVLICILCPSIIALFFEKILPKKWLDGTGKMFKPKKFEKKLFQKLNVKNWKDHIPNLGHVGEDISNEHSKPSKEVLEYFVYQTCLGEVVHKFCLLTCTITLILIAIAKVDIFLKIALPLWFVYATINLLSITVQRFNRPRLMMMLERLKRQEQKTDKDTQQN